MSKTAALTKAIELHGGLTALSRAMNVSDVAIYKWKQNGNVPPKRALQIEQLTKGAVTRQDLRPDLFGLAALEG